ncbi:MAG TPA: MBL fold metallo-hydrolase [Fimbriimonas sp.]|nr:MBL fold metallo-hydrolase [Fimbriimonas sp.]
MFTYGIAALLSMPSQDQPTALELLEKSMNVLGGRGRLESIRSIKAKFTSHSMLAEQSERPTGPYLHVYLSGSQTVDLDRTEVSCEATTAGLVYGAREVPRKFSVSPDSAKGAAPLEAWLARRRLSLGPERALFVAAAAQDLRLEKPRNFNGVAHDVISFGWGGSKVSLLLKQGTASPSAIQTQSLMPFPWSIWGDVVATTRWGAWSAQQGGIMTPSQFTTDVNGITIEDTTILSAEITLGPGTATLHPPIVLPPENPVPMLARYKPTVVAEGIVQYQGPFNTFVVSQPDGLVVIEPVFNSFFASAFLKKLEQDFPGKRVKAVVATDDAWPHFGGLRSFVYKGAEVIILDLNRPIVQRLIDAPYKSQPDELAVNPLKPKYRLVKRKLSLGSGPNRMEFYPISGQGSERMMMAYFPERKLLYGSDLLQRVANGFFFPSYPKELAAAVEREKLTVETVFAEHLGPTPWNLVTDFVNKIGKS